jgi:hypothetical protein
MNAATETRGDLVKRCRNLERRFNRLGNQQIGAQWARQWADALLDTRCPPQMYSNWIEQQEARADRLERLAVSV